MKQFNLKIFHYLYFLFLFCHPIAYTQSVSKTGFIDKLSIEFGVLPFNKAWIGSKSSSFVDFMINSRFSFKSSQNSYLGIEYYKLLRIPTNETWTLSTRDNFYIIGPFFRQYIVAKYFTPFLEGSFGYGNVCDCAIYNPNYEKKIYVLPDRYYIGSALGIELPLNSALSLIFNLKVFYMLNTTTNKFLHIRPFLNLNLYLSKLKKNKVPIVHNPRL